jgi:hypothetical protein
VARTHEQPDQESAMERVTGTISDGDRVIVRHMPMMMLETEPRGYAGWRGCFDWPRDATPPRLQRFYRLETSDGRSGQIVIVGSEEIESHESTRVRFQITGPFD